MNTTDFEVSKIHVGHEPDQFEKTLLLQSSLARPPLLLQSPGFGKYSNKTVHKTPYMTTKKLLMLRWLSHPVRYPHEDLCKGFLLQRHLRL